MIWNRNYVLFNIYTKYQKFWIRFSLWGVTQYDGDKSYEFKYYLSF